MARTVFDNAMVAHVWASMRQPYGRSANGNLSFDGLTLYSYATPIARIVRDTNGGLCALHFDGNYSLSTGKHQSEAYAATSHMRRFEVHYVTARSEGRAPSLPRGLEAWRPANEHMAEIDLIHAANMHALLEAFDASVSAMMDRKPSINTEGTLWERETEDCAYTSLGAILRPSVEYAETFDLPAPRRNLPEIALMVAQSFAHKLVAWNDPKKAAKRAKARAASEAKRAAQEALREAARREEEASRQRSYAENLEAWRKGAPVPTYHLPLNNPDFRGRLYPDTRPTGYALRVKGDTLETSGGASVPLTHAIRVLRAVEACRAKGEGWKRNGHTLHVGHFQVDEIMPNGDFKAGCHFIQWQEVERVAGALGLLGGGGGKEEAV